MNKPDRYSCYRRGLVLLMMWASLHVAWADETASDVPGDTSNAPASTNKQAAPGSSIQLKTTSVTGSRELPKVLVIVPWKNPEAIGPGGRPLASLVEEALTPIDPDVFRRQLSYYTELRSADVKRSKQVVDEPISK